MIDVITKFWAEWALGVIAAALAIGYRRLTRRIGTTISENEALKQGLRALLRDRIIQGYNHYEGKGHWPIYARDSMLDMYKQYAALGGNGTVSDLMADLAELPTENKDRGEMKWIGNGN